MKRWTLFLVGLAASIGITIGLWSAGIAGGALFLFLPFLFWPRRMESPAAPAACSTCGRPRGSGDNFCPVDGTPY